MIDQGVALYFCELKKVAEPSNQSSVYYLELRPRRLVLTEVPRKTLLG